MNDKNIVVDIDSINSTMQLMESKCNSLIDLINNYRIMFEDTKEYFDTNSGNFYREIVKEYLDDMEKYVKNDFLEYIEQLETIKNTYSNEMINISNNIQGVKKS